MPLISCPECGKEVSDQAEQCPNCGYPIHRKAVEGEKKAKKEAAIARAQAQKEAAAATVRSKKPLIVAGCAAAVLIAAALLFVLVIQPQQKMAPYRTVGGYVTFGTYPQTESGSDKTPIEWLVLDYDAANHRSLLISRYGLDAKPYNTEFIDITWEKCTLRKWLNSEFLNTAFTAQEQKGIVLTNVDNSTAQGYSGWNANGWNNTQDRVFLLSYAEANKCFNVELWQPGSSSNITKSRVAPTAYAIAQGAYTSSDYKTAEGAAAGWWWLRSPGSSQSYAARVSYGGSLLSLNVDDGGASVRPAFWLNLDADIF